MTARIAPLALLALLALSACASPASADGVTLASTKSPAQLLRNEIANRLPAAAVAGDPVQSDKSEGCDSAGLVRAWKSSAEFTIVAERRSQVKQVAENLAQTFVVQGWSESTRETSARVVEHRLTSGTSSSDVRITASTGDNATLLVVVSGPCVQTDGPDSDEVKALENR